MTPRVGLGFDVHPFAADEPDSPRLVLGGVTIAGAPKLSGHSDGDAVAHAVADAMLGAAGLGDLGTRYPASDDRYKDADSIALLHEVARAVHRAGWNVGNIDVVIAAEQPELAPHVDAMARNVAGALGAVSEPTRGGVPVSVHAKRGEGLGFVGRAEGIAVWAVTLLDR